MAARKPHRCELLIFTPFAINWRWCCCEDCWCVVCRYTSVTMTTVPGLAVTCPAAATLRTCFPVGDLAVRATSDYSGEGWTHLPVTPTLTLSLSLTPPSLRRHVSFVDCPGHDILMATMLNGAAVMDAALLLIGNP